MTTENTLLAEQGKNGITPKPAVDPPEVQALLARIAAMEAAQSSYPPRVPPDVAPPNPLRLDLGCGTQKRAGFHGVDSRPFPGVDTVCDLASVKWPWADSSVDEVRCAQTLEHIPEHEDAWLLPAEPTPGARCVRVARYPRAHFLNELWRVLKPGAKATVETPYWCSGRAYGDPTHRDHPVCEWTWPYLDLEWRKVQAPHTLEIYSCDFVTGYGYNLAPHLAGRNDEYRMEALRDHKDAAYDMVATLTARK